MTLIEASENTYAIDTSDVPSLNQGISSTAKHLMTSQNLLEDESRAWDEGVLEDFKKQRDALVSVRDMFDRRDRYAKNNIPQLERRIETNEHKLANLMARPEGAPVKSGEQEKLEQAVRAVSFFCRRRVYISSAVMNAKYVINRISSRSWINMRAECLSKNASAMNWASSNNPNITSAGSIKSGARSASSMRNCKRTIGEH